MAYGSNPAFGKSLPLFSVVLTVPHGSLLSFPPLSSQTCTEQQDLPGNRGSNPAGVTGSRSDVRSERKVRGCCTEQCHPEWGRLSLNAVVLWFGDCGPR